MLIDSNKTQTPNRTNNPLMMTFGSQPFQKQGIQSERTSINKFDPDNQISNFQTHSGNIGSSPNIIIPSPLNLLPNFNPVQPNFANQINIQANSGNSINTITHSTNKSDNDSSGSSGNNNAIALGNPLNSMSSLNNNQINNDSVNLIASENNLAKSVKTGLDEKEKSPPKKLKQFPTKNIVKF